MRLAAIKLIDVLQPRLVGELVNTHVVAHVHEPTLFTHRLMAGQLVLNQSIMVRVHVGDPFNSHR